MPVPTGVIGGTGAAPPALPPHLQVGGSAGGAPHGGSDSARPGARGVAQLTLTQRGGVKVSSAGGRGGPRRRFGPFPAGSLEKAGSAARQVLAGRSGCAAPLGAAHRAISASHAEARRFRPRFHPQVGRRTINTRGPVARAPRKVTRLLRRAYAWSALVTSSRPCPACRRRRAYRPVPSLAVRQPRPR